MRPSWALLLFALLAGCAGNPPDLRRSESCTWLEAVPHPVHGHHSQRLDCDDVRGPGQATLEIPPCPYEQEVLLDRQYAVGQVHLTVRSAGHTVFDAHLERPVPLDERRWSMRLAPGNATQVQLELGRDAGGLPFSGSFVAALTCL